VSNLQALLERVEAASGPDRDIDLELALIGYPHTTREHWLTDELGRLAFGSQRRYTASLDAAVGLVEKMLPGRSWEVREQKHSSFPRAIGAQALIMSMSENETMRGDSSARAKTPALALIAALLKAMIYQSNPERPGVE